MRKGITEDMAITIGIDISDRFTEAYAIDGDGEWVESWRMRTKRGPLGDGLSRYAGARVVLEAGCHSPWISRQLQQQGFEVTRAGARAPHGVYGAASATIAPRCREKGRSWFAEDRC